MGFRGLAFALALAAGLLCIPAASVAAPSIASISPSNGPTSGNVPITIRGSSFAASGNEARVGGNACTISMESGTEIVCSLPEGTGLDDAVIVTSGGEPSNEALFDYDAPFISSLTPANGPTSGNVPITIRGQNFGPAAADSARSVTIGSTPCPLLPSSSSHIEAQCTLPEGQGLGWSLAIEVDGQASNGAGFAYDPPHIDSITPSSVPLAGGVRLTISGANFGASAGVLIGGSNCPVDVQTHSSVECTSPAGSGSGVPVVVSVSGQSDSSSLDYRDPACGDGIVDPDEDCDDTNDTDLDGCSAACETEHTEDKDQAGCITGLNKSGAGVTKAQAKATADCAKNAVAGTACIGVGTPAGVEKANAKTASTFEKKCQLLPDFGPVDVAAVNQHSAEEEIALAHDLFGADADAALAPDALAPGRARCQQDVMKAWDKLAVAHLKSFGKCKKAGLKEGTIRARSHLDACLGYIDEDSSLAKPTSAMFASLIDSCLNYSEDLVAAFPGVCAMSSDVGVCIEGRVRCRTCRTLAAIDDLGVDCDLHDDGASNASCP